MAVSSDQPQTVVTRMSQADWPECHRLIGAHLHIVQHEELELLGVLHAQLRLAVGNHQLQMLPLHGWIKFNAVGLRKV